MNTTYLHSTTTELYVRGEVYNDLVKRYSKLENAIELQGREIVQLKDELRSLRPPEAKFEVGQIVVRVENGNAFTVRSRRLDPKGGWLWQYTTRDPFEGSWSAETEFRALKPEEIG